MSFWRKISIWVSTILRYSSRLLNRETTWNCKLIKSRLKAIIVENQGCKSIGNLLRLTWKKMNPDNKIKTESSVLFLSFFFFCACVLGGRGELYVSAYVSVTTVLHSLYAPCLSFSFKKFRILMVPDPTCVHFDYFTEYKYQVTLPPNLDEKNSSTLLAFVRNLKFEPFLSHDLHFSYIHSNLVSHTVSFRDKLLVRWPAMPGEENIVIMQYPNTIQGSLFSENVCINKHHHKH